MLERLTLQDFETSVGASYGLAVGAQSVAMTLCDARAIGSAPLGDATRTPFSLEFEAPLPGDFRDLLAALERDAARLRDA